MRFTLSGKHLVLLAGAGALAVTGAVLLAPAASAAPAPPKPVACSGCWHPAVRTSWDWVLSKVPTAPYRAVKMYDVDGFGNTAADVASLHKAGIKAMCYISAGAYENWRPDAAKFPAARSGWTSAMCRSPAACCVRSWTPDWTCATARASTWSNSTTSTAIPIRPASR